MPRFLLLLAALIVGYTTYAFVLTVYRVLHGTTGGGILIWSSFMSAVMLGVAALLAKIARDRLRTTSGSSEGVINWVLLVWIPAALFLIGYGLVGLDGAIILGFGGIFVAAVLAPSVKPNFLTSTVTVQGVRVSAAVAVFFWPLFACAFFLAFRTHHRTLAVILAALSVPLFRALDVIARRIIARIREHRLGDAVVH